MKKIALCALSLAALGMLCACGGPTNTDGPQGGGQGGEPAPALPQYTVSEEHLALDANGAEFTCESVQKRENSPLAGKLFYWLGSSVTYGASSGAESMAEFLAALTGCVSVKDAVSGTTIYENGSNCYTLRMVNSAVFDRTAKPDAFICQISTNDCTNDRLEKRGELPTAVAATLADCDRSTTLGGVEYILRFVTDKWNCPIYFYSGAYFGDDGARKNANPKGSEYGKLVSQVKEIAALWREAGYPVDVIDLYNDADFNAAVSDEYYAWCTGDAIHPKKAGYLNWWTPYFEAFLINHLKFY